jgi:hypothetical protein
MSFAASGIIAGGATAVKASMHVRPKVVQGAETTRRPVDGIVAGG